MNELCAIAVAAIRPALAGERPALPAAGELPPHLAQPGASFVTLERGRQLLGCVGTLEASDPLGIDVARHAIGAAFKDPRVPPITVDDFEVMTVKVSVLSPAAPLAVPSFDALAAALRPRIDGVVIEAGTRRATFLPSVWEKVPDLTAFLDSLWDKARLRRRTWPADLRVATYTTVEESDPGPRPFLVRR